MRRVTKSMGFLRSEELHWVPGGACYRVGMGFTFTALVGVDGLAQIPMVWNSATCIDACNTCKISG